MNLSMRTCRWLLAAIIVSCTVVVTNAQTRIYFARGATRATARGYLRGARASASFVLRAKAGQHMKVEIRAQGATRGAVIFPSGKQDGGPGGVIYDEKVDETGDYRISVGESSMAEPWRGSFTVVVDIVSEGSGSGNRDLSGYVGKYPSELFKKEPGLKTRLRALLGANYKTFFDRMQVETPIENDGGVLITRGCMAHQCTIEEGVLAIDLSNDTLHVAIKSNSRYRPTWSERGTIPEPLRRAMRE